MSRTKKAGPTQIDEVFLRLYDSKTIVKLLYSQPLLTTTRCSWFLHLHLRRSRRKLSSDGSRDLFRPVEQGDTEYYTPVQLLKKLSRTGVCNWRTYLSSDPDVLDCRPNFAKVTCKACKKAIIVGLDRGVSVRIRSWLGHKTQCSYLQWVGKFLFSSIHFDV